ncbi:hypothetical protein COOONC_21877 [Cooperia oncophora]
MILRRLKRSRHPVQRGHCRASEDRLRHIMIDLTLLDASATRDDFTVGMSGQVTSTKTNEVSPYRLPFPFRLPHNTQRRMAEIAISDYTVNSMLTSHRLFSFSKRIRSCFTSTPTLPVSEVFLKTTCSVNEVCLSDQIGTAYPGRTLEIIIRTTRPPVNTILHQAMS